MALALALLSLLMMTALLLPLLSMSSSEVQIAANLTAASQARQCAEAGLEYALSEMNLPGGTPFVSSTIDVNGNVVCSFVVTPATVSPTEVALTSTSTLATVRPGSSTASQNFVLDLSTGRWSAKAGTFRGR
jgi:Tfp pilus assembly protein PilX